MDNSPRPTRSKLFGRVAEARFFTTSLVIHMLLVSLLGSIVLFKASKEYTTFEVGSGSFVEEDSPVASDEMETAAEFEEPTQSVSTETAQTTPSVNSAIGTLSESPASWSTNVSFDRMSVGTTLSSMPSLQKGVAGAGMKGQMGKASSISFMGVKSDSRRAVFLLDVSGSMVLENKGGGQAYGDLKQQLITLVDGMDPTTQFNVIMFGPGAADVFQPGAVAASDAKVAELKAWLEPYMREKAGLLHPSYTKTPFRNSYGTTRLDFALNAAFEMEAETIFILTDGTPNVMQPGEPKVMEDWESYKQKHKAEFEQFEKQLAEYKVKHAGEHAAARQKADSMNKSTQGRSKELYQWEEFAPNYPKVPKNYYPPVRAVTAKDFNQMMKTLQEQIYLPKGIPAPNVNVIGYYVDEAAEDYLKDMTRGFPGKYKTFKK